MSIGVGWQQIAEEAERRLREHDERAQVRIGVGAFGMPRAIVNAPALGRRTRRSVIAHVELQALRTCELCGAPGTSHGASVICIWCEDCHRQQMTR